MNELEKAIAKLAELERAWLDYSGNNPDKYQADIRRARADVRNIEERMKASGEIPRTAEEELHHRLDLAFPKASSKQVVAFDGKQYMRTFRPLAKSNSGKTVKEWGKYWSEVSSTK
jgi:hypothetical protein